MEPSERPGRRRRKLRSIINVLDIFIYTLKNLSVEPVIFLIFLGWIFGSTLQSPGIYRRICELHYGKGIDCGRLSHESDEDMVQRRNAEWSLFTAIAYFIPAIFADTILGAYGDRNGRKVNILLGIAGISISEFGYLLVLSKRVNAPFWVVPMFNVASGVTGFITMIPVSCNAYLSDITSDSDMLTVRAGIFSTFQSFASVIGAIVAGFASTFKVVYAIDIELGLFLVAFVYVLWKIPQKPGLEEIARRYTNGAQRPPFFSELKQLLTEGFETYKKRRLGHRRAFIFVAVVVLMLNYTTYVETRISIVMNSYVFRRLDEGALGWDQRDLGFWNGTGFAINMVGTLLGLYLFKQVLRLRETTIMIIALLSSAARALLIALTTKWQHMYIANACGLFSGLVQPAAVSFLVQLVSPEEVGRVFALFGIGNDLAFVLTYLVYSNIYRATQNWRPGFLFMFIAGVQVIAALAIFWVHVQSVYDGLGKRSRTQQPDIRRAISVIGMPPETETPADPPEHKKKLKKRPSMLDHALARRAERNTQVLDTWWESSPADVREMSGSVY